MILPAPGKQAGAPHPDPVTDWRQVRWAALRSRSSCTGTPGRNHPGLKLDRGAG